METKVVMQNKKAQSLLVTRDPESTLVHVMTCEISVQIEAFLRSDLVMLLGLIAVRTL